MKVATIICNHNFGEYVESAINSALNQTYPNTVFIIDDNSTDNSMEIISKYHGRINIAKTDENIGPSEARNILIDAAINNGFDAVAILDADDEMYPTKIEKCVAKLQSDEAIGVVYADYDTLHVEDGYLIPEYKQAFCRLKMAEHCIVHSGAVIKNEALLAVKNENGFYNRTMRTCEDYELWVRISKKYIICHIAESLTLVRKHKKSSANIIPKSVWKENWEKVAKVYA